LDCRLLSSFGLKPKASRSLKEEGIAIDYLDLQFRVLNTSL